LEISYGWKPHDIDKDRDAAGSHTASLQLLCTVGGNQARLDARTECKILERSPKGGEAGHVHHCKVAVEDKRISFKVLATIKGFFEDIIAINALFK
jgi:hypothetical protein